MLSNVAMSVAYDSVYILKSIEEAHIVCGTYLVTVIIVCWVICRNMYDNTLVDHLLLYCSRVRLMYILQYEWHTVYRN
jgi:hypothetical protein